MFEKLVAIEPVSLIPSAEKALFHLIKFLEGIINCIVFYKRRKFKHIKYLHVYFVLFEEMFRNGSSGQPVLLCFDCTYSITLVYEQIYLFLYLFCKIITFNQRVLKNKSKIREKSALSSGDFKIIQAYKIAKC